MIMNVTIERMIMEYDDNVRTVVMELINRIVRAQDEKELRETVAACATLTDLDKYFVYGYGSHHFWVKQRKLSDPTQTFEQRRMIVKF